MKGMLSRHDVARKLGRRVSRGEFERIFSALRVHTYAHLKWGIQFNAKGKVIVDDDGVPVRVQYHPQSLVMHEASPKFRRKHRATIGDAHSYRARFAS